MEFVVAEIKRRINGLEWLKIDIELALFTFVGDDFTAVNNKTVGWHSVIQLQTLLGRCDSTEDG